MASSKGQTAHQPTTPSKPRSGARRKQLNRERTVPEAPHRCLREETKGSMPNCFYGGRAQMLREFAKKWINGTTLHYYFFNRNSDGSDGNWVGSNSQKAIIRRAILDWQDIGMGVKFQEVTNREEAEIRIGFAQKEDSWSLVGRDAIDLAENPDERTMNFSAGLTKKSGSKRALAEIGRALGFGHYGMDCSPSEDWSSAVSMAQQVYPPMKRFVEKELAPFDSVRIGVGPGQQRDFRIRPQLSRNYKIEVKGQSDVVLVLFEDVGGLDLFEEMDRELEFVAGDDDSGENRSTSINTRLYRDREYVLRARLIFSGIHHGPTILLW